MFPRKQRFDGSIGVLLAILATVMVFMGWLLGTMFEYVLGFWFHKDVPFVLDVVLGFVTNGVLLAATIVTFLIDLFAR